MRKVRDELLDGPARVQKSLSPAVRAALESLVKAQAERAAAIAKIIKRIRVNPPIEYACLACSTGVTKAEHDAQGGECATEGCDSYLHELTAEGKAKANRGRRPVTIAPADDEDEKADERKAKDPHSGDPSVHRPWIKDDEEEEEEDGHAATEMLEGDARRLRQHFPAPGEPRAAGRLDGRHLPARRRKRGPIIF